VHRFQAAEVDAGLDLGIVPANAVRGDLRVRLEGLHQPTLTEGRRIDALREVAERLAGFGGLGIEFFQ